MPDGFELQQEDATPMTHRCLGIGLAAALVLAGCGTVETRFTVEQLTNARVAVEAAEKVDAKNLSPEPLRRAQDALAIAGDAYTNGEYERAFAFAKKATLYARVASSQSQQEQAEGRVLAARSRLEQLQRQTEAGTTAVPGVPADLTPTAGAGTPTPVSLTVRSEDTDR